MNPDPQTVPESILVFIPGTDGDGREIVTDPKFLAICKGCHAALLGCYFRGEGLPYDNPSGGSGRAMDEALAYLAVQTHQFPVAHTRRFSSSDFRRATVEPAKPGEDDLHLHIHWTGGSRLCRMEGQILLTIDSSEKGTLRIPVFGAVASANP